VLRVAAIDTETRAVREAVEVLEIQGDQAYVRGTIVDGNTIIAHGVHRVTPGTAVAPVES